MKKLLSALLIGVMSATAFAGYNVYNFKASVKRLNPVIKTYKYSTTTIDGKADAKKPFDTYAVANDTITGWLAIPECVKCAADGDTNVWGQFNADENKAQLAVYHKLDFDKKDDLFVFENVDVKAGLFNAGVGVREDDITISYKNLKSAWVALDFTSNYAEEDTDVAYASEDNPVKFGFFGRDYQEGSFAATGFGQAAVQIITTKTPGTPGTSAGLCTPGTPAVPGTTETTSCFAISNASGSIIGSFTIQAPCGTAIWDVCLVNDEDRALSATVEQGVVTGTWQMKYNKKVTNLFEASLAEDATLTFAEFVAYEAGFETTIYADREAN